MRNFLFTTFFMICLVLTGIAQNSQLSVSGSVFEVIQNNQVPVAGQDVYIRIDSTCCGFFYENTVVTDGQGHYSDIIPLPPEVQQGMVYISTYDPCLEENLVQNIPFGGGMNSITADFLLCMYYPPQCQAEFYYYNDSTNYLSFQFINTSMGNPDTWTWDFGDGTSSYEENPVHMFPGEGMYYVCLTISNYDSNCFSTECHEVYVYENPGGSGCENYFVYTNNGDPYTFAFEGYLYNFPPMALSYTWDFGDGTTGYGQTITHTFIPQKCDHYQVCLTTMALDSLNNDTCYSTSCQEVFINNQGQCQAMFWFMPDSMDMQTIHFIDMSFGSYNTPPDSWLWNFGDSTFSTDQNPVHTYSQPGTYYVCLTITADSNNCTSTNCQEVWVNTFPQDCQNFFWFQPMGDRTFNFVGQVMWGGMMDPPQTTYTWEFGDGTTGFGKEIMHAFPSDSINFYTVCLYTATITPNGDSCSTYSCQDVPMGNQPPGPCVNWFDYIPDSNLTVTFIGHIMSPFPTEYTWEFGDGTSGTGQQVTHSYAEVGPYEVHLQTVDSLGCTWESQMEIWVGNLGFSIFGNVFLEPNLAADHASVDLMTFDSIGQNLVQVRTTFVNAYGYYEFLDVPMNCGMLYYVQAELTDTSAYFGQYLPTYHISSLNWEDAQPVCPMCGFAADIFMIPAGTYGSGPGAISGIVTELGVRSSLTGVEVLLLNQDNQGLTYVRSDENGQFNFSELAYGTYIIDAEILGVHTTPASVTLNETNTSVSVEIQVQGGNANIVFGIPDHQGIISSMSELYPNPVSGNANIDLALDSPSQVQIRVFNQIGQLIMQDSYELGSGSHTLPFDMSSLKPGIYMMQIIAGEGGSVVKKFDKK